jgi:hypothetical protein
VIPRIRIEGLVGCTNNEDKGEEGGRRGKKEGGRI